MRGRRARARPAITRMDLLLQSMNLFSELIKLYLSISTILSPNRKAQRYSVLFQLTHSNTS